MEIALNREIAAGPRARAALGIVFFLSATVLGSFVRIPLPFTPVPVTLQTFFVLLCGACLGARSAGASQLLYIAIGAAGAPVFAGAAGGLAALLGPTGGYLAGFAAAAYMIAALKHRCDGYWRTLLLFSLASLLILVCGALWLKVSMGLSARTAFAMGAAPFIAGDLLKAFAACAVYMRFRGRIEGMF